jgi:hypothetical protein
MKYDISIYILLGISIKASKQQRAKLWKSATENHRLTNKRKAAEEAVLWIVNVLMPIRRNLLSDADPTPSFTHTLLENMCVFLLSASLNCFIFSVTVIGVTSFSYIFDCTNNYKF